MSYELENHFNRLLKLLDLEAEAEKERLLRERNRLSPSAAEAAGATLLQLRIRDESSGLGGRTIVVLGKRDPRQPLPWTRMGVGTPVVLSPQVNDEQVGWRGVVCERHSNTLSVAMPESPEVEPDVDLRLDVSTDETARDRQRRALVASKQAPRDRLGRLRDVLMGVSAPRFQDVPLDATVGASLNDSQREAIRFALGAEDFALIHGPPGTGKTTTTAEFIRAAVRRDRKVLATAPSNLAVDNLLERLLRLGVKAVRVGHPARVLPELREHTLDLMVESHDDMKVAQKLVKEAYQLRAKAGKYTRAKPLPGARKELRDEAKALLADARRLESQVVESILDGADVVCATLTGIHPEVFGERRFDTAVIDEAGQATEPACWIPLLRCDRLVLAGDPFQLPPTIVSPEAQRDGLGVSLLERLMAARGESVSRRLTVQYRMNEAIGEFSSCEFYEGTLQADPSVARHVLREMLDVTDDPRTATPLEFIDTAGAGYDEESEAEGESRFNSQEASLVQRLVLRFLELGVARRDIAVITPYAAQSRWIRRLDGLADIEIDTVDGFQGREKEAVILSLVRSNPRGEIGFLNDIRRMNVALTRARRKLIVIGDSATIGGHPFYERLLKYFEGQNAYRSVWEETV